MDFFWYKNRILNAQVRECMGWSWFGHRGRMENRRAVQMDNLRGLLSIRKMERVPNARIRGLCRVTKREDERIEEGALR